jgi:hypothetical protein
MEKTENKIENAQPEEPPQGFLNIWLVYLHPGKLNKVAPAVLFRK